MTVKEYLQQYRDADREINTKLEQIQRLRELATKTTQTLNPDKVQTATENKTEIIVSKIVDLEQEINIEVDQMIALRDLVESTIGQVTDSVQQIILRRRYINGERWEKIAVDLNYTYRHVTRIHGEALLSVKDVLECPIKK